MYAATINLVHIAIFDGDACSTIRDVAWSEPLITMDYISGSGLKSIPVVSTLTGSPSWCNFSPSLTSVEMSIYDDGTIMWMDSFESMSMTASTWAMTIDYEDSNEIGTYLIRYRYATSPDGLVAVP